MNFLIDSFFISMLAFFGVAPYPGSMSSQWEVSSPWTVSDSGYSLSASSSEVLDFCRSNPEKYLVFPQVIHSAHEFFLDGNLIGLHGDKSFQRANSFYEHPFLKCGSITSGKRFEWRVTTYSRLFARVSEWPIMKSSPNSNNFFAVTLNELAFGMLLVVSVFSLLIFRKRVSDVSTYSVSLGAVTLSGYFMFVVSDRFGWGLSMLNAHKAADTMLWAGCFFFLRAFEENKLLNAKLNFFLRVSIISGIFIILLGRTGNEVQFGTMLPMVPFLICSSNIIYRLFLRQRNEGFSYQNAANFISILCFSLFGLNDVLSILGIVNTELVMPIGFLLGVFGLTLAVNAAIDKTYRQRDILLDTLELKVEEKTRHLENALEQLKYTQSDLEHLVQIAKRAAHDIRSPVTALNSILKSFSGGRLDGQQDLVNQVAIRINSIADELLKEYQSFAGASSQHIEGLQSSGTYLLRSIQKIVVEKQYEYHDDKRIALFLRAEQVNPRLVIPISEMVLHRIVSNLINNSIDAISENGEIYIQLKVEKEFATIAIVDFGVGISETVLFSLRKNEFASHGRKNHEKSGSGIGLKFAHDEVSKVGGTLDIESKEGVGTRISISVPLKAR